MHYHQLIYLSWSVVILSKEKSKYNKNKTQRNNRTWVIKIFFLTFLIANIFSITSNSMMENFSIILSLFTLLIIMLIGILFDAIGISVTAASEVPLLSMASKKIRGAVQAIKLIKNADRVSSFCNDVVGDICGIISGSAGGILVVRLTTSGITWNQPLMSILISSFIAAFTVGGKALGKTMAIHNSQNIVYYVGYLLSFFPQGNNRKNSGRNDRKRN